ncbi:MAG: FAD-dependent oxidoreductase [Clostridia bacterium]|nr:FAD-dependent oxidoreductase [Clostridia bacterium]
MNKTEVLIIGGGPCGLAAAVGAAKTGAHVVVLERDERLGGILTQCIHNGFGLHLFNEELTGPEYAERWKEKVAEFSNITTITGAFCTSIERAGDKWVVTASSSGGLIEVEARSVILALGCRERPAGSIFLNGERPAGVFSAGCAQKLINIEGKKVGNRAVILGSGDIGLIMARRLICEGSEVVGIYEIMPQSGGLARNITQCVQDFGIPLHLNTTITRVVGKKRVEGVFIAPVDEKLRPKYELEKFIPCDTLLLSVGLQPENEIAKNLGLEFNNITNSYVVDEYYQTSEAGLFCAGNVLHVNDLVDNVSAEGERAGECAGLYAKNKLKYAKKIEITHDDHIKYTAPKYIYDDKNGTAKISFRVNKNYKRTIIRALSAGKEISKRPSPAVTAGEMQTLFIDKTKILNDLHLEIEVME